MTHYNSSFKIPMQRYSNNNKHNVYCAYILKNSGSEAQQKRNLASQKRGQAKVIIGACNRRNVMVEKQFQTNMFSDCYEWCLVPEDFSVRGI